MSRVQELEKQIAELDPVELRDLREWFERYDAEARDGRLIPIRRAASCPGSMHLYHLLVDHGFSFPDVTWDLAPLGAFLKELRRIPKPERSE
ncbi:MAG: hypothetical protein H7039_21820 [Bryobacteraceae bacterium]|nr:hypothetical protein [Bryobacteraceae bacterium]